MTSQTISIGSCAAIYVCNAAVESGYLPFWIGVVFVLACGFTATHVWKRRRIKNER